MVTYEQHQVRLEYARDLFNQMGIIESADDRKISYSPLRAQLAQEMLENLDGRTGDIEDGIVTVNLSKDDLEKILSIGPHYDVEIHVRFLVRQTKVAIKFTDFKVSPP